MTQYVMIKCIKIHCHKVIVNDIFKFYCLILKNQKIMNIIIIKIFPQKSLFISILGIACYLA